MFCKNCGTQLDDDSQFCEKCGTRIHATAYEDMHNVESISSNQTNNEKRINAYHASRRSMFLVMGILIVCILIIGGILILGDNGQPSYKKPIEVEAETIMEFVTYPPRDDIEDEMEEIYYANVIMDQEKWEYFSWSHNIPKPETCVKGLKLIRNSDGMYIYMADTESQENFSDLVTTYLLIMMADCGIEVEEVESPMYYINDGKVSAAWGTGNDSNLGGKFMIIAPLS